MEGFWRCNKFRISSVIRILQVEENVLGQVANRDDKKRVPGRLTTHVLCGSTKGTSEDRRNRPSWVFRIRLWRVSRTSPAAAPKLMALDGSRELYDDWNTNMSLLKVTFANSILPSITFPNSPEVVSGF
jgi:hypothetical protein